ncbi:MAG TPA: DNA repair protein RecN [Candidatus Binataceae bacterium]|nr:DNA repair protein RecN [Candidatus Binataceae bacterium]
MLTELRIRNFAVIEEAALSFGPGLNVLSGETGAGKTIIMTALGLLIGGRSSPEMVRTGAREAVVEGVFQLEGESPIADACEWLDAENPKELIVRRTVAEAGRSRVSLNDKLATVQTLGRLGAALVQTYGQHEQQSLLQRENHLAMLDRHAGLESEVAAYRALFQSASAARGQLVELERRERERSDLLELARFRLAELERAELVEGEDERLAAERTVLANATRLAETAVAAEQSLYGAERSAVDLISEAYARLAEGASLDSKLGAVLELVASARTNLEEAARGLEAYAAQIEADPARLEQIEIRLQELIRLKRKYGGTLVDAIETLKRTRAEIAELETAAETRAAAAAEMDRLLDRLFESAQLLSARRVREAAALKHRMEAELKTLGMRNAAFEARLGQLGKTEAEFVRDGLAAGSTGIDTVEFYLAPNLGQPAIALQRVASGGELSRVMLALKRLEAQRRGIASMIFDEVDAGIGGAAAEIVGRKLKQLARFHQILCVTHLAQIAAFADHHFVVEKEERRGATRSRVGALKPADRAAELARMLGGDEASDKFLRAARELVNRARQ